MYEEIFNQIRSAANKRNLKDSTIHAYCTSVAHFLNHTAKDIDALTTDDVDIFLTEKKLSGISPETYNHYHSGIRFFYKKILKKQNHRHLSLLPLHRHHKIFDKYVSDSGRCQCGIQIQIFQSRQIVNCSCHSV